MRTVIENIVINDLEKKSCQLRRHYRLSIAYIAISLIPIALLSNLMDVNHIFMEISVKVQIYSALLALIYGLRCKYIQRRLIHDTEDVNTINFYSDVYDMDFFATRINNKIVAQGRKLTTYEANLYAKNKNKN